MLTMILQGHGSRRPCFVRQVHEVQPQEYQVAEPRSICPFVSLMTSSLCLCLPCSGANKTSTRSNGHGCMLQYALLHLFGYDLSIDDLKAFRVCDSAIPSAPFTWT